jgi:hypothetical protein
MTVGPVFRGGLTACEALPLLSLRPPTPSCKMSNTDTYTLYCFVQGHGNIIDVTISSTAPISELRREIKKESSLFREISASDLTLWKVRYL